MVEVEVGLDLRQAVRKLEAITEELDKRQRENGLKYFVPNPIQQKALMSTARTIVYSGGNRSGKTVYGACELAMAVTKEYPSWYPRVKRFYRPVKAVVVATNFPVIERVIEGKILTYLPKDHIIKLRRTPQGYLSKVFLKDGSTIDILTNEMDTMAFESADWDFYWGDEPQSEAKYKAIKRGLVDRMGRTVLTFTPLIEPWMKEKLCDQADGKRIEMFIADIHDNKFDIKGNEILTQEAIDEFMLSLDPDDIETRIHGKFFHLRGMIYKNFGNAHIAEWEYTDPGFAQCPVINVTDPHDRLNHHSIWAFIDKTGDIFVDDEMVIPGDLMELAAGIKAREHVRIYNMRKRILDPNFGAKPAKVGTNITVQQELAKYGVATMLGNDNREAGHLKVKELLRYDTKRPIDATNKPKIFFHKTRCPETIRSMRNYQYLENRSSDDKDPNEKAKEKDAHGADTVRYLAMDNPSYTGPRVSEPDLEGVYV